MPLIPQNSSTKFFGSSIHSFKNEKLSYFEALYELTVALLEKTFYLNIKNTLSPLYNLKNQYPLNNEKHLIFHQTVKKHNWHKI